MTEFRFGSLFGDLDREVERFLELYGRQKRPIVQFTQSAWRPLVDVYETADMVVALVELAGVDQAEVEIVVHDQTLQVRGERSAVYQHEPQSYHVMEIGKGRFERLIELPVRVDGDRTTAEMVNGMLQICMPKAKRESVSIKITASESGDGTQT